MAEETTKASEVAKSVKVDESTHREENPSPKGQIGKDVKDPAFENLSDTEAHLPKGQGSENGKENKINLLLDLNLNVSVELGKTSMIIREILELGRGSIIEFDKLVSDPVDILINGRKMAEGEVVVVDKHFGIRVTSMVDPSERLKGLKK
jgi:flagellar motor switch protein FliN/FliY